MKRRTVKIPIRNTKDYLKIFNGMFNLTDKEIDVLSVFIDKHIEFDGKINVFSAEVKKQVANELDMDNFNVLNVYIKRLKDKKVIKKKDDYIIHPLLIRNPNEDGILFLWQNEKK